MTWRYQATHRAIKTPGGATEDVFEVREVYEGLNDDGSLSWTENAIALVSDTKDGLIEVLQTMLKDEVLQMMLKDVQHFDVLEVDE